MWKNFAWSNVNMAAKTFTLASTTMTYNLFIVFCIVATLLAEPIRAERRCGGHRGYITCSGLLPTVSEMKSWNGTIELSISKYSGELKTNRIEGNGDPFVRSMQIHSGELTGIQNEFFRRFTDGTLKQLHINIVGGSSKLNKSVLDGLERSLSTLHVNAHTLTDITGLATLTKLDKLSLTRTELSELPSNFNQVIERVSRLKLSHNELTTMPWDAVTKRLKDVKFLALELGSNKWHCDCKLKPVLEATSAERMKITNFVCHSPPELKNIGLEALRISSVCTAPPIDEPKKDQTPLKPSTDNESAGKDSSNKTPTSTDGKGSIKEELDVPTAGTFSTSLIIAIAGGFGIIVLIATAVICWKAKKSRHETQGQQHRNKKYCAVIETPTEPDKSDRNPDNEHRSSYNGRNFDRNECQPLAPSYNGNNYPDGRL